MNNVEHCFGILLAAGVLYPAFGLLLSPMFALPRWQLVRSQSLPMHCGLIASNYESDNWVIPNTVYVDGVFTALMGCLLPGATVAKRYMQNLGTGSR